MKDLKKIKSQKESRDRAREKRQVDPFDKVRKKMVDIFYKHFPELKDI